MCNRKVNIESRKDKSRIERKRPVAWLRETYTNRMHLKSQLDHVVTSFPGILIPFRSIPELLPTCAPQGCRCNLWPQITRAHSSLIDFPCSFYLTVLFLDRLLPGVIERRQWARSSSFLRTKFYDVVLRFHIFQSTLWHVRLDHSEHLSTYWRGLWLFPS